MVTAYRIAVQMMIRFFNLWHLKFEILNLNFLGPIFGSGARYVVTAPTPAKRVRNDHDSNNQLDNTRGDFYIHQHNHSN